jgi:DNA polymerase-3 subunit delta'
MNQENIFDGREAIKHFFEKSLEKRSLSHAYLLYGAQGIGKNAMADFFAKMLLCDQKEQYTPCNHCRNCILFDAKNHPDFHCITMKEGESSIKIDQIRAIETVVQKHAYRASRIVCIIRSAEEMTDQAQNALLKTLEQPPSNVIIILTVTNISAVLSTILSRCQIINVPTMPQKNIEKLLSKLGVQAQQAAVAARIAQGLPNKAIEVAQSEAYNQTRDGIFEVVATLHTKNMSNAIDAVEFFINNKQSIEWLFDIMESWYRDIMVWQETGNDALLFNCDWINAIKQAATVVSKKSAAHIIEAIIQSRKRIKQSTNFQLVMEELLLTVVEGEAYANGSWRTI